MKEASFYKRLKDKNVVCELCPNNCFIPDCFNGWCAVRKNIGGKLYTLNYERPVSIAVDPIEKKPLLFFHPGEKILSLGTFGCNLHCKNCQNFEISQSEYFNDLLEAVKVVPAKEIVQEAKKLGLKLIAFTYNEPTVFYEYMLEVARIAKQQGLLTVIVSNGLIQEEPLKKLIPFLDAANIDVKSFNNSFYKEVSGCLAKEPVLALKKTLKLLYSRGIHLELTHLAIPGYSSEKEIDRIARWVKEELSEDVPLHISRFFPYYKMIDKQPTSVEFLKRLKAAADKHLKKVLLGNI